MATCRFIIPTYNRPRYLSRLLQYYAAFGERLRIVVADSSSDENKGINRGAIASVSNLDIQYLDYASEVNPYHKVADVLQHVPEEYAVVCADDDFNVPNGINESIAFLEKNPGFAVAHGRYIGFRLETDQSGQQRFLWAPAYLNESIAFSDPAARLTRHLSDYSQITFYAVHRTKILRMVFEEMVKSQVDYRFFGELLLSMLTLVHGKLKCLGVLYAARDEGSCGRWPGLRDAVEWGVYGQEYAKFRECLSTHLSQQSQMGIEEAGKVVDAAMAAFMKKYYPSKPRISFTGRMHRLLVSLNLPGELDRAIRKVYHVVTGTSANRHTTERPPNPADHEDFERIRLAVLSSGITFQEDDPGRYLPDHPPPPAPGASTLR